MVTSALKMVTDLERIGDQASNIVEIADYVTADMTFRTDIKEMAENTVRMVTNSIDSFVKKDISIADSVIRMDDTVDALFDKVKSEIMSIVSAESNNAESLLDLLMIAKILKG